MARTRSRSSTALLFALTSLLAARSARPAQPSPSDPHPVSRFVQRSESVSPVDLDRAALHRGTIEGPEVDRFRFRLERGDFAAVRLGQLDTDLVLTMFDPEGTQIAIHDRSAAGEREVATFVAARSGWHDVQVAIFDWRGARSRYEIELARVEPEAATPAARARQRLDVWYDARSPGGAVAVIQNGTIVLEEYRGLANVEHRLPIGPRTRFDLASVSKQFTGMAVATVMASGRLSPTDPVRRFLPDLPDFGAPISIRHLLNHTSGLRDWDVPFGLRGLAIQNGISNPEILRFVRDQRELNFPPGTEQEYSNTGYNLLALIVERVTGAPFAEWTRSHLFEPLGLLDTSFNGDARAVLADKASSYEGRVPEVRLDSAASTSAMGSSSLNSTLADVVRWLHFLDAGRPGFEPARAIAAQPGTLDDGRSSHYAFGQWHRDRRGTPWIGHLGLAAGFRISVRRFPTAGLGVVFLANDGDDATYARAEEIENLFLGLDPEPTVAPSDGDAPLPKRWAPSEDEARRIAGVYFSDELATAYRLVSTPTGLVAEHSVHGRIPLDGLSEDRWTSSAWYLPELILVRDASGAVTGFRVSSPGARRLFFRRLP